MQLALAQARRAADVGEVPVGCVIVRAGQVLAATHNLSETLQVPTAHAELLALEQAARRLGSWRLEGCSLYVTLEPCVMCAGALVLARIEKLVFGATDPKAGAVVSKFHVLEPGKLNHDVRVEQGLLAEESAALLKEFFRRLRN
jgi:tRNA(adenine34) deaminase